MSRAAVKRPFAIAVRAAQRQSTSSVTIDVTVTNTSELPIRWDKAFESFLGISIRAGDGTEIALRHLDEKPMDEMSTGSRFFWISPCESYSRSIELTGKVRHFAYGMAMFAFDNGAGGDIPFVSEEYQSLAIPAGVTSIDVRISWVGPPEDSFQQLFGVSPTKLGIPFQYADAAVKIEIATDD